VGGNGADANVGRGTDVEHRAAVDELAHQSRVLDGADPVADPVCLQRVQCAPDRFGADHLARMRDGAETTLTGEPERVGELLRGRLALDPAQPDPDDAPVAARDRPAYDVRRLL